MVKKLKVHFSTYGVPCTRISDNEPEFVCQEFYDFAIEWDFEHFPSAPTHSDADGKVELGVKAAKSMLKNCKKSNSDPDLALLEIRNAPTQGEVQVPLNACSANVPNRYYQPPKNNLLPGKVSS